jgi:hypothetical protein
VEHAQAEVRSKRWHDIPESGRARDTSAEPLQADNPPRTDCNPRATGLCSGDWNRFVRFAERSASAVKGGQQARTETLDKTA